MKKYIWLIPCITTIIIMVVIFCFSNQESNDSSELSSGFTEKIINVVPVIKDKPVVEKKKIIKKVHGAVRKLAHFSIYALLGISVYLTMILKNNKNKFAWIYTIAFVCVYAVTDEFHQRFIPGRSGQITDVILDTLGGTFGIALIVALRKLYNKLFGKRFAEV